ncbi:MAG: gamma-glutamyl-gamma-aminobutyrate hydrolase family protein [Alphaproteobacteria bacterium]|jgi:putative glutamine amidotransferase|nr:glutamine amidotransferase [Rhodospirillaceae bacterium]MDP6405374.1 gamma-glutamyl-gamma-aminobutyrate hydrolase family protein [Alphaproteobacteria bacterium]MDP6623372.1 gamma-glutamyl-gamma-aminobutyrate hydrolase family protein [Alphaproteobacteria bacterium]
MVKARRLGLSMRTADAVEYVEERDALARDWLAFMAAVMPEAAWLPLPNAGDQAAEFVRDWDLDGLILTGGDDIGAAPMRDATERALFKHAWQAHLPLFGVCRGMQFIQSLLGGPLEDCSRDEHVAQRHRVSIVAQPCAGLPAEAEVNSFHTVGIRAEALAPPLEALANTADGWIEACHRPGRPLIAVMWHPERESEPADLDRTLIRHLFGLGGN